MGKTWREKFSEAAPSHNTGVEIPANMLAQLGQGTMLISSPRAIDAVVREVPSGRIVTLPDLVARLARDAGTTTACPMTTGIFLRVVAECAELDAAEGREVAPYWRVIKSKGRLNAKFPGGVFGQAERLQAEGHQVARNRHGAPSQLEDFERCRHKL